MKLNKIILVSCIAVISACNSLDVPPLNIVQDKDVFNSESGIYAYIARLYRELPIEDFKYNDDGFNKFANYTCTFTYTGELLMCPVDMKWDNYNGDSFHAWIYGSVRNVNYFLQELPKYKGAFTEDKINLWTGEAYFIRAYYYFAMVKRYGGVPIVKEVQNYPEKGIEELKVARNTEQEVYDFIAADLDEAIQLLPETSPAKGRINKYAAYALKSRAMLYAGSIAKYGTIQLNGILGIPSSSAESYFQSSYDAATKLEGKYSLYNKNDDKYLNYCNVFLDGDSPENIFVKYYKYPDYCHSYALLHTPWQMRGAQNYSSRFNPTLDFVESFEDINGNSGVLDIGTTENPKRFADRMDLFANAEPRLRATVIFPGDVFKDEVIDVQKGLYPTYSPTSEPMVSANFDLKYENKAVIGASGPGTNETTSTGFYIRKYMDPSIPRSSVASDRTETPWIECRYAEVLLNRAEAAFELGKKDDALVCVNEIRDRAGAKTYNNADLNIEKIRHERRMELAYENHTFWDLRRWRIANNEINSRQYWALYPYYIYDEGKYIFKKEAVGPKYIFEIKTYYTKIQDTEIAKNNKIIQNPGY